jgi:DNA-binding NarL/FixJ family response regulator
MNKIRIVIAEDHDVYLRGLRLLLNNSGRYDVTATALNGATLLETLPTAAFDLLLLDVQLPDTEPEPLLKTIRTQYPDAKIVYHTLMRGTRFIHRLVKYNIQGYVLKNAPFEELDAALQSIHAGGTYFSKDIDIISDDKQDALQTITVDDHKVEEILTKREIEILRLVCKEYSSSEIAERLFLSVSTVDTHRKNILAKLGVNNTVGLVKYALRQNLAD